MSLFSYQDNDSTFVGLANFLNILLARDWPVFSPLSFYTTLGVTILWTVANVTLHVGIGVALAMLLSEPWLKMRVRRAASLLSGHRPVARGQQRVENRETG